MKFKDGYWRVKEGFQIFNATEVRDVKVVGEKLIVFCACRHVTRRGETFNEPLITIEYSSPMENIIRVRAYHYKGAQNAGPEFDLNLPGIPCSTIVKSEERYELKSGDLTLRISGSGDYKSAYYFNDRLLTQNGFKSTAYIIDNQKDCFMREQLDLGVGELVYGLGERFTAFIKNGQSIDMWNDDSGTSSELAYKNIPFYVTNRNYGVLVNHPENVSFEVASEDVSRVQFSVPGQYIEYFIIGGSTLKNVIGSYTALTGKPALPPAWSFGLWLSTSTSPPHDEQKVTEMVDEMFSRDIPFHVYYFCCFWMREYQFCDFKWNSDAYPDPEGFLKKLKSKNLNISVWINPYIAQKSHLFDEGKANGYLLKKSNGDVWQWNRWQAGMALVDFTNPEAREWYKDKLRELVDMGVDSFKTDFGERVPTDVEYYDGSDPMKMHNFYSYLFQQAVFEVLEEKKGKNNALIFGRSATVGCQKFPVHWGGDCSSTYASMAETLRGGLSIGLAGYGFWSHDISGFEGMASPDLYKRWTAFGMLTSHSRLHGNNSYRMPWLFGEESVEVVKYFTKLKCGLMPYIFTSSVETVRTGVPLLRAMLLEFENDQTCAYLDRQYMFGSDILVAPVFSETGTVSYYLPEGIWTSFISGEEVTGGRWVEENHDYFSLPVMVRPNAVIPVGSDTTRPDYDYANDITFHVFQMSEGKSLVCEVLDINADLCAKLMITRSHDQISVVVSDTIKPWKILMRGIEKIDHLKNGSAQTDNLGALITPLDGHNSMTFELSK
ncbi:MAG: alpha-xylosidase [Saccharofermentanales bacterium]